MQDRGQPNGQEPEAPGGAADGWRGVVGERAWLGRAQPAPGGRPLPGRQGPARPIVPPTGDLAAAGRDDGGGGRRAARAAGLRPRPGPPPGVRRRCLPLMPNGERLRVRGGGGGVGLGREMCLPVGAAPEPDFAPEFLASPPYFLEEAKDSARSILDKLKWWKILLEVDYLYGWVHESVSISPGAAWTYEEPTPVGFGTQIDDRFQKAFAHEMGHFFNLDHLASFTDEVGWDVGVPDGRLKRGLGNLKGIAKNDIRTPGSLTDQTWIGTGSYLSAMNYILTPQQASTLLQTIVVGVDDTLTGFDGQPVPLSRMGPPLASGTQGAGELRVLDGQGVQLFLTRFDAPTIDSPSGYFAGGSVIELPYSASAQSIELRHNGILQATKTRSAHAPSVVVNNPTTGNVLGSSLTVAWQATDADGDTLLADIRYSKDGIEWKLLAFRSTASSITVPTDALASSPNATIRVSISDGFNVTEVNVCGLQLPTNKPPQVEIESPVTNAHYFAGSNVILSAQTDDLEDRALPDSSISWHSNISGSSALGYGALLEMTGLAIGTHLIECRATDSGGAVTSAFVTIVVDP